MKMARRTGVSGRAGRAAWESGPAPRGRIPALQRRAQKSPAAAANHLKRITAGQRTGSRLFFGADFLQSEQVGAAPRTQGLSEVSDWRLSASAVSSTRLRSQVSFQQCPTPRLGSGQRSTESLCGLVPDDRPLIPSSAVGRTETRLVVCLPVSVFPVMWSRGQRCPGKPALWWRDRTGGFTRRALGIDPRAVAVSLLFACRGHANSRQVDQLSKVVKSPDTTRIKC